ncbi:MAG: alpha/beta hydrolase [Betaproteobacteria bacterium]|nr:alpha/beta hydrolase [Betaproteobacteria bacterium]
MPDIAVAGRKLNYVWQGSGARTLVFLHEGLGSIAQWRDFPERVALATGCRALLYDRYGYGQSDVLAEERVDLDFMLREALVALPALLVALGVENPVLVGHSDGASIALIHAGAGHAVQGVVAIAPHVFVEDISVRSIAGAVRTFETTDLPQRLAKYHRDSRKTFYLWSDAWLDPAFRNWNIEASLAGIRCPLLAIQGEEDQYGTMAQVDAIARQAGGRCELLKLPDCGHAPHKDQPERVLRTIAEFVDWLDRRERRGDADAGT